jgi:NADPH2:quinone reductase
MRAVQITRTGGPEVLELAEVELAQPGPGEALVRHRAIGLNFIDTYQRSGLYPMALPAVLGTEAAGVVEAVGDGVAGVKPGDRVAYASQPGAYAEASIQKADRLVHLPADVSFEIAAAATLKGLTAEYLVRQIWPIEAGDVVLVHAAAGGVGSILTQWLKHVGVRVIGTAGSEAKAEQARAHGCETVLLYEHEDVAARVRELTGGVGVKVAYDAVGKATFEASLKSLARRGLFASYGNASGPAPAVTPLTLLQHGSLYITRPTLNDYVGTPESLKTAANALFHVIETGAVKVEIGQTFALDQVRQAHEALEARQTTGATLITL